MSDRTAKHDMFRLERVYPAAPTRVYAAFATEEGKHSWFSGPHDEWVSLERFFDFREGGRERAKGRFHNGAISQFDATYFDIVPNERIVYAYEMHVDGKRISVSLATIEFKPEGAGTRLILTEQGAFVDGYDDNGSRQRGTEGLLDQLGHALAH